MSNDFNIQLHCDGDAAVRYVLDAVEALPYRLDDNRLALAHAEAVALSDYPRFKDLNVRLIMTYQWAQDSDSLHTLNGSLDTAHSIGPERSLLLEPFGNLTDIGNNVVYGSDWIPSSHSKSALPA
ncbi:hypothetical protein V500_02098 [Pseudogymnoascus sp. VKM F-4518 (FW-2643)]|nr:hypothetical protein V500_02098 [Pseudogymnoascus sp. VKM F-4518 (FW-2643)]